MNDSERAQLKIQHKKERDGRVRDRIKALLLYDKRWTFAEIAKALFLSQDAIRYHITECKDSKKLKPENWGSAEKSKQLEEHLRQPTYLYVKDMVAYVQFTWDISFIVPGLHSWLKRYEFSYKKPAVVPGKADKQQEELWLSEYEKLKKNLSKNETICFMDGVHLTHNVQRIYGWVKTGIRKKIPGNIGRSRLKSSGLVDIISHKVFIQEDEMLNAKMSFLRKSKEACPTKNKVHLFSDNAGYYRNKMVTLSLKTSKIQLYFLKPYSLNLNPIECLWKWMKKRVIYNTYYQEFEDLKSAVFGFFSVLLTFDAGSMLGLCFRCRVRNKFRSIGSPLLTF